MEKRHFVKDIDKPDREALLQSYAEKPLRGFLTMDVHGLDEDGALIHIYSEFVPRRSDLPVRIRVAEGTRQDEIVYYLAEAIKAVKRDWPHIVASSLTDNRHSQQ